MRACEAAVVAMVDLVVDEDIVVGAVVVEDVVVGVVVVVVEGVDVVVVVVVVAAAEKIIFQLLHCVLIFGILECIIFE